MLRSGLTVMVAIGIAALSAAAASKPCSCWYGTVTDAASCTCNCNTGYLAPYCAYQAGDNVTVQVTYDAPNASNFVSQQAETQIYSHYGGSLGSVTFIEIDETDNAFRYFYSGYLVVLFKMPGAMASSLLDDARAQAAWLSQPTGQQLPILDATVLTLNVAPQSDLAGSTIYNGSMFSIHSHDIIFLVFVVVLVVAMLLECVCVQNKEDIVAEKERLRIEKGRVGDITALHLHPSGADSPRPGESAMSSNASSPKAQPESVVLVINPMMGSDPQAL